MFKKIRRSIGVTLFSSVVVAMNMPVQYTGALSIKDGLPGLMSKSIKMDVPTVTPTLSLDYKMVEDTTEEGMSLSGTSMGSTGNMQINAPKSDATGVFTYEDVVLTEDERRYIANTITHEVGTWPDRLETNDISQCPGVGVACCILNRHVSGYWEFPDTIQGIITQPGAFSYISGYWNRTDYAEDWCYDALDYALASGDMTGKAYWFANMSICAGNSFFEGDTITFLYSDYAGHSYFKLRE